MSKYKKKAEGCIAITITITMTITMTMTEIIGEILSGSLASYLHLISDTVSSVGVLLGGTAIKIWGIVWIDPLITVLISLYILKETWHVIKKTVDILMQSSAPLDYESIKRDIEAIEKVNSIHHVHSWMSNEKTIYFEAHIDIEDMQISEAELIYDKIEHFLREHYGISHVTLQAEVEYSRI